MSSARCCTALCRCVQRLVPGVIHMSWYNFADPFEIHHKKICRPVFGDSRRGSQLVAGIGEFATLNWSQFAAKGLERHFFLS